jgi:hypothetical protein
MDLEGKPREIFHLLDFQACNRLEGTGTVAYTCNPRYSEVEIGRIEAQK